MQFTETNKKNICQGDCQFSKHLKQTPTSGFVHHKKMKAWISAGGPDICTVQPRQQKNVNTLLQITHLLPVEAFQFFEDVLFLYFSTAV